MPRTKQRTPELRDKVLAAAVDLLAGEGAAGLTARSLAARAETSAPALYELFGDKSGVVRELYFEGFRRLFSELSALAETEDPVADLWALATAYRRFLRSNRELAEVMFSRPFTDFSPGEEELEATGSVRILVVGRVRRCIEAGRLRGDETDVAHVFVALVQGMAFAEAAGRLGTSTESVERRWRLAVGTLLNGFGAQRVVAPAALVRAPEPRGTPGEHRLVEAGRQPGDEVDELGVGTDQGAPAIALDRGEDLACRLLGARDEGAFEVRHGLVGVAGDRRPRWDPSGRCARCWS